MAAKKVTVKYFVDPRHDAEGNWSYAVMREALYRGKPSGGFVAQYTDESTADEVCLLLNRRKGWES